MIDPTHPPTEPTPRPLPARVRAPLVGAVVLALPFAALLGFLSRNAGASTSAAEIAYALAWPVVAPALLAAFTTWTAAGSSGAREALRVLLFGRAEDEARGARALRLFVHVWLLLGAAVSILTLLAFGLIGLAAVDGSNDTNPALIAEFLRFPMLAPIGPLLIGRLLCGAAADRVDPDPRGRSAVGELAYLMFLGPLVAALAFIVIPFTPIR